MTHAIMIQTYRCAGCGTRHTAPAPYGGVRHTACSEACAVRARRAAWWRNHDPRLRALIATTWKEETVP